MAKRSKTTRKAVSHTKEQAAKLPGEIGVLPTVTDETNEAERDTHEMPALAQPKRPGAIATVIDPQLKEAIDRMIASHRPATTLKGVLEDALVTYLQQKGFWPPGEPGDQR